MCGDREGEKKKRGKTIRRNWKKKERERKSEGTEAAG